MEAVADRKEVLVLITHGDIAKLEEEIKTKKKRREEGGQTMSEEFGGHDQAANGCLFVI